MGANAESDPVGLDVYSAFTVEADISRRFGRHFAAELILASASHEVTSMVDGVEVPLGSVELLPPRCSRCTTSCPMPGCIPASAPA